MSYPAESRFESSEPYSAWWYEAHSPARQLVSSQGYTILTELSHAMPSIRPPHYGGGVRAVSVPVTAAWTPQLNAALRQLAVHHGYPGAAAAMDWNAASRAVCPASMQFALWALRLAPWGGREPFHALAEVQLPAGGARMPRWGRSVSPPPATRVARGLFTALRRPSFAAQDVDASGRPLSPVAPSGFFAASPRPAGDLRRGPPPGVCGKCAAFPG